MATVIIAVFFVGTPWGYKYAMGRLHVPLEVVEASETSAFTLALWVAAIVLPADAMPRPPMPGHGVQACQLFTALWAGVDTDGPGRGTQPRGTMIGTRGSLPTTIID